MLMASRKSLVIVLQNQMLTSVLCCLFSVVIISRDVLNYNDTFRTMASPQNDSVGTVTHLNKSLGGSGET